MGSLTHVCVWSSKGWTHIAPEEVARSHPGESVSARSGLFMCELCGQYAKSYIHLLILRCKILVGNTQTLELHPVDAGCFKQIKRENCFTSCGIPHTATLPMPT